MILLRKTDLAASGKLDMRPFLVNRSYCCVDIDHIIDRFPKQRSR